jgi:hypothetical protein
MAPDAGVPGATARRNWLTAPGDRRVAQDAQLDGTEGAKTAVAPRTAAARLLVKALHLSRSSKCARCGSQSRRRAPGCSHGCATAVKVC